MPAAIAEPVQDTTLRLNSLCVENFMRVKALRVEANGRHVVISGPNASGKTSAVDAIWAALGGKPSKEMPEPIHRGEASATARLDLGEFVVQRKWTKSGPSLTITMSDGSRATKPQALLDGLLGKYALDPLAFLEQRPQDQVDDVLSVCEVQVPVKAVEEITGRKHPVRPDESADAYLMRLSADEVGHYYVERRDAHRALTQKEAALSEQRDALGVIGGPLPEGEVENSPEGILKAIDGLQSKADARRATMDVARCSRQEHALGVSKVNTLKREQAEREAQAKELAEQMARLKAQYESKMNAIGDLIGRIQKGEDTCRDLDADATADEEAAKQLSDPAAQIGELRAKLATIQGANERMAKRRVLSEQLEGFAKDVEHAAAEHKRLDKTMDALRGLRAHLLDGLDLGVDGLSVGDSELRLNGITFKQASLAQRIRVACAVAMRQRPRLKLLRIDNGEHLDSHSWQIVREMADANDWQVVMTRVADVGELKVEIVDGQ